MLQIAAVILMNKIFVMWFLQMLDFFGFTFYPRMICSSSSKFVLTICDLSEVLFIGLFTVLQVGVILLLWLRGGGVKSYCMEKMCWFFFNEVTIGKAVLVNAALYKLQGMGNEGKEWVGCEEGICMFFVFINPILIEIIRTHYFLGSPDYVGIASPY